jgi:hypothetical protein
MRGVLWSALLHVVVGHGYISGGVAMVFTILFMIFFDAVHPLAVSTSIIFAFRVGDESNLVLFALAVLITATLVVLERAMMRLVTRFGG